MEADSSEKATRPIKRHYELAKSLGAFCNLAQ